MLTRHRLLSILTALALLCAAPLMAQVANLSDEPPVAQNRAQQQDPGDDAGVQAEAEMEDPASAEASLSADTDTRDGTEAEAQVETQVETHTETGGGSMDSGETLPETAGPLALLAVLGTGGLASAFGLRRLRRS